ncbi:MAG: ATP-binding protein [Gemmatimonadaceae bacterium]
MAGPMKVSLSDASRLTALRDAIRYRPYPHASFDAVTRVVTRVLQVPIALVSLVDDRQQHFVGATGLGAELATCRSTPLGESLCQHVVTSGATLRIDDIRVHPTYASHPAIASLGVVAYLGVPLTTSSRLTLGTLCAIDAQARGWTDAEVALLADLAQSVTAELELRGSLAEHETAAQSRDDGFEVEGLPTRAQAEAALAHRDAQRQHVQKMEAIGNLAGGVAHDFNNLLTVIRTNSDLLMERVPTTLRVSPLLQEIQTAAQQATVLTRHLLTFGQKQVVRPEAVAVAPALAGLVPVLQRLMPPTVTLAMRKELRGASVMVDPGDLEQLVMNLVLNARDAMTTGGVIHLTATRERLYQSRRMASGTVEPGAYVRLTVADTGVGIPLDVLPRIFEPFFSTKRGDGLGTGLGLSTVFGIVQQSHGGVQVESAPDAGATFTVYLPEAPSPHTMTVVADGDAPEAKRYCILVVDDEAGVRTVVQRVLEARGYRLVLATNGAEGLRRMEEMPDGVDLLLTDIMMPVMNGLELADVMRSRRPGLPVLLMSGYADAESVQRQLLDPLVAFLPKPFTAAGLTDAIRALLEPRTTS